MLGVAVGLEVAELVEEVDGAVGDEEPEEMGVDDAEVEATVTVPLISLWAIGFEP